MRVLFRPRLRLHNYFVLETAGLDRRLLHRCCPVAPLMPGSSTLHPARIHWQQSQQQQQQQTPVSDAAVQRVINQRAPSGDEGGAISATYRYVLVSRLDLATPSVGMVCRVELNGELRTLLQSWML